MQLFFSVLFSQGDSLSVSLKKQNPSSFSRLIIKGNVKVVLFQSDSVATPRIEGSEKFLENVFIVQTDDDLIVNTRAFKDMKKEGSVYIPVNALRYIEIYADAKIISYSTIISPELNILIDGNCIISLVLKGKLNIRNTEDYDWSFRRVFEKSKLPVYKENVLKY